MVDRFSKLVGVGVVVACLTAGCTTVNPYTRETQTSKAVKGAGIGAAAGAIAGLLTKGDKLENALIGAGVGALAGGAHRTAAAIRVSLSANPSAASTQSA